MMDAVMQKIITPSVMDVIGLSKNTVAGDESQFMRPTAEDLYSHKSFALLHCK
jgi:hypothetical protein